MSQTFDDLARGPKPLPKDEVGDLRSMLEGIDLSEFETSPDPDTALRLGSSEGFGLEALRGMLGGLGKEWDAPEQGPAEALAEIVGPDDAELISHLPEEQVSRLAQTYSGVRQQAGKYTSKSGNRVVMDLLFDEPLADLVDAQRASCADLEPWQVLRHVVGSICKTVETDKEGRDDAFQASRSAPLGELVQSGNTMCREKALYAHLLLAAEGIPTVIVAGSRADSGGPHGRHAWLETEAGDVIDAMWGEIAPAGQSVHRKRYVDDVKVDQPMKPADPLTPERLEAAVARAKGKVN